MKSSKNWKGMVTSTFKDFSDFAIKGNAIDMAVGIIVGAAFGKIVNSLVNDIIMPPIGLLIGGVDFSDLSITLKQGSEGVDPVSIHYGLFLNTAINFLIVAGAIFFVVKGINALRKEKKEKKNKKKCPECLMEIPLEAKRCGHCTTILTSGSAKK